jgi:hypothetical protein
LNSLGAMLRVSLGEVCHSQNHYVTTGHGRADYGSTCPDSSPASVEKLVKRPSINQITDAAWPVSKTGFLRNWPEALVGLCKGTPSKQFALTTERIPGCECRSRNGTPLS